MNRFLFEPLSLEHIPLLHKWMQEPHVRQWWGEGKEWTYEQLVEKYRSYTCGYKIEQGIRKEISAFVIILQQRAIGFIQLYNALDFPREGFNVDEVWLEGSKSIAAIDFYIGEPDCVGVGIGPQVLREFLSRQVFPNFDACLVDPEKNNVAAVKAYTKAGFSAVLDLSHCIVMIARKNYQGLS